MNRLTIKNSDGTHSQPTHTTFEKMFNRLAEFEDFLEEQGFESLEELKKSFEVWNSDDDEQFINSNDNMKLRCYIFAKNQMKYYMKENQALKNRWQKLTNYLIKNEKTKVTKFAFLCRTILDKMQELEKDGENEKES